MSAVCCPSCWTWSDLGSRTTCKRCGAPLVMASGQPVAELLGAPPPPPPPPGMPGMPQPAYAGAPAGFPGVAAPSAPPATTAHNWVAIARVMTFASGVLGAVALLLVGLLVRHLTLSTIDARTGLPVATTLDLGPILAVAAVVTLLVVGAVTWGLGNRTFRIVWMALTVLSMVRTVATLGALAASSTTGSLLAVSIGSLGYSAVYVVVLALSVMRPEPVRYR